VFDLDNDGEVSKNITWYKQDNQGYWIYQPDWNNETFIPSSVTDKNSIWMGKISAFDGDQWSKYYYTQLLTIINSPPEISEIEYISTESQYFFVEDQLIEISYIFSDNDNDSDQSVVKWFINVIHQSQFDGMDTIPSFYTEVGQIWFAQITPFDGEGFGDKIYTINTTIEDIPDILDFGVSSINDTEGHYKFWFDIAINSVNPVGYPITQLTLLVNETDQSSIPVIWNGTYYTTEWKYSRYELLGSRVSAIIFIQISINYNEITSIILEYSSFEFQFVDTAAPRVLDVEIKLDNEENPLEVTFLVTTEEFGNGIQSAVISYIYIPSGEINESVHQKSKILQTNLLPKGYRTSSLTFVSGNATGIGLWKTTVDFDANTTVLILYQIELIDNSGNIDQNAWKQGNDVSKAFKVVITNPGFSNEELLGFLFIVIIVISVFSFIIIKKIRTEELVGLDIEKVMEEAKEVPQEDIDRSLDDHSMGIIISKFDQSHGPIPIFVHPEMLKDNIDKLIDLSDRSFSSTRFVENFDREIQLNRINSRGGAENITLNILLHKPFETIMTQFLKVLSPDIQEIHRLMDQEPDQRDEIQEKIRSLRKTVSSIIIAYKKLYEDMTIEEID
jgi:hypothetical protein